MLLFEDDDQKLSAVRLLRGYIQLLGSHIDAFLTSDVHIRRLSMALMQVLQFDCMTIEIVQERTAGSCYLLFGFVSQFELQHFL